MNDRIPLKNRRHGVTVEVTHAGQEYAVCFGVLYADGWRVYEMFCSPTERAKTGSDALSEIRDGCVALSLLLQYGARLGDILNSFHEDRQEGETSGPPSSALGRVARAGFALEEELNERR